MTRAPLVAMLGLALWGLLVLLDARPARAADRGQPVASIAPSDLRTAQAQVEIPRRNGAAGKRDAFAPHSWTPPAAAAKPKPPPAPSAPPPPPPPPTAPALTLAYLGQLDVAGEPTVYYLAQADRVHAVSVGDTIDGVYRVLAAEGRALGLLYLPLNIKQLLPMNRPS